MLRGPYNGMVAQHHQARELRKQGFGYKYIGALLDVPWGTIRNWVSDIPAPSAHSKWAESQRASSLESITSQQAIRSYLLRNRGNSCQECCIDFWNGKPLSLEVHHVDGNGDNNTENNLQLLCPNCHSQTDDYRNKSRPASPTR
jgi:5-methylcytosine-specific restriction endonuclease McrA